MQTHWFHRKPLPFGDLFSDCFRSDCYSNPQIDKSCKQPDRPLNRRPERKHSANETVESRRFASELCIGSVELCSLGRVCGLRKICQTGRQDELFSFCHPKAEDHRTQNTNLGCNHSSEKRSAKAWSEASKEAAVILIQTLVGVHDCCLVFLFVECKPLTNPAGRISTNYKFGDISTSYTPASEVVLSA